MSDWQIKLTTSWADKEKMQEASSEIIDLLRKKYGFSHIQCAIILDSLLGSLQEEMQKVFDGEEEERKLRREH